MPHQLLDAHKLRQLEKEIGGYLLGSQVGTGKTYTYVLSALLDVAETVLSHVDRHLPKEKESAIRAKMEEHAPNSLGHRSGLSLAHQEEPSGILTVPEAENLIESLGTENALCARGAYLPTLIVTSPSNISQLFDKLKTEIPECEILCFWGHSSVFEGGFTSLLDNNDYRNAYRRVMDGLMAISHQPKAGRTFIISTPQTMRRRLMVKRRTGFLWKDRGKASRLNSQLEFHEHDPSPSTTDLIPCQRDRDAEIVKVSWELDDRCVRRGHRFRRIIIDDVSAVKRHRGPTLSFVEKHAHDFTGLVSAEFMLNSVQDAHALLKHLSTPHQLVFEDLPSNAVSSFLYHEHYDPFQRVSSLPDGRAATGIFSEANYPDGLPDSIARMKQKYEENQGRLWLLIPELLPQCRSKADFSSASVLHNLMSRIQVKRHLTTPLKLPNGDITAAGAHLRPPTIRMEEVQFVDGRQRELMLRLGKCLETTMRKPTTTDASNEDSQTPNKRRNTSIFSSFRWGTMSSIDSKIVPLMLTMTNFGDFLEDIQDLAKLWDYRGATQEQYKPNDGEGGLSRDHLLKLLHNAAANQFPFAFYWETTLKNPTPIPPKDRHSWIHYMGSNAPVIVRVLELVVKYMMEEKKSVVVFTANPWGTSFMAGFLDMCGVKPIVLDGWKSPLARQKIIDEWNDTDVSGPRALVASLQIAASGIDLHHNCSIGIFSCLHWNAGTMNLAMGRLIRIGQKKQVQIHIVKAAGTFMDYQEKIMMDKYIPIFATEMNHPAHLKGIAFIMSCYEVLRESWGQSFNRYAWTLLGYGLEDKQVLDPESFNDNITVFVGHLISSVVFYTWRLSIEEADEFTVHLWNAGPVLQKEAMKMLAEVPESHKANPLLYYETVSGFDRDWGQVFQDWNNSSSEMEEGLSKAERATREGYEKFVDQMNNPDDYAEVAGWEEGEDEEDEMGENLDEDVDEGICLDDEGDAIMVG